jgi:ribosomal protein S18 acetylase RimI-like enzyme
MYPIEIIQLTPDDWQAYRAIRLEALQTEPQAFGSAYATNLNHPESFWRGRLAEAAAGQRGWLLFARAQDRLVGMIGAYITDDPAVVEIISTYVTPEFRGQGIGRALMDAILHAVSAHSTFQTARLGVNVDQTAALRLYESFGFQIIGTEQVLMGDGQAHDQCIMAKSLS